VVDVLSGSLYLIVGEHKEVSRDNNGLSTVKERVLPGQGEMVSAGRHCWVLRTKKFCDCGHIFNSESSVIIVNSIQ
jgi:hypothetical protein